MSKMDKLTKDSNEFVMEVHIPILASWLQDLPVKPTHQQLINCGQGQLFLAAHVCNESLNRFLRILSGSLLTKITEY